jgi:hypothetical protein
MKRASLRTCEERLVACEERASEEREVSLTPTQRHTPRIGHEPRVCVRGEGGREAVCEGRGRQGGEYISILYFIDISLF